MLMRVLRLSCFEFDGLGPSMKGCLILKNATFALLFVLDPFGMVLEPHSKICLLILNPDLDV